MKLSEAVDQYFRDRQSQGRINSQRTVTTYRFFFDKLIEDVDNRDPRLVGRADIKLTLARWANPNTQSLARTAMLGLFRWMVEEAIRDTNPVEQTSAPRKRPVNVYRLTRDEVRLLLEACSTTRERRVMFLGVCAGLRNTELRMLRGKHFTRVGYVWVSADIAKGGTERYVPVIEDLAPVVREIVAHVPLGDLVTPSLRSLNPGINTHLGPRRRQLSSGGLVDIVARVAERAGISARIHPHLLRHAFGDHIARYADMRVAQTMLGHANVATTQRYTGTPSLDDLTEAVQGMSFGLSLTRHDLSLAAARGPHNIPLHGPGHVKAFGAALLELKQAFRPLLFGWPNA